MNSPHRCVTYNIFRMYQPKMMEFSLPKVPRKSHLLLGSSSAGGGCLSWAGLRAAGATPVPAFKKPQCSPEERFKPMKLLKMFVASGLKHSFGPSGLLLFCCRTAPIVFPPLTQSFCLLSLCPPLSVLIFPLLLFALVVLSSIAFLCQHQEMDLLEQVAILFVVNKPSILTVN